MSFEHTMRPSERKDPLGVLERTVGGRYRIRSYLGGGGFAHVYEGSDLRFDEDLSGDKGRIAIKMMRPGGTTGVADFRREAHLMKQFQHPNFVAVSDYGVEEDGLAWLVMEFLAGSTLSDYLARHKYRMPPAKLRKFVSETCNALQEAHDQNLVHRDLKPQNILVVNEGQRTENFKILDFGIATKVDARNELANLTMSYEVGTPEYMSPEQADGKRDGVPITHRSDIYSYGVILYQLLTGRVPFPRAGGSKMELYKCLSDVVNSPPPRFAEVPPIQAIPGRANLKKLEKLVRECLEKDPSRRPTTMLQIRERFLEAFEPPVAKPPQARGWGLSIASIIVIIAIVCVMFPFWIGKDPDQSALVPPAPAEPPATVTPFYRVQFRDRELTAGESKEFEVLLERHSFPHPIRLDFPKIPEGIKTSPSPAKRDEVDLPVTIVVDLNVPPRDYPIDWIAVADDAGDEKPPEQLGTFILSVRSPKFWVPATERRFERSPEARLVSHAGINFSERIAAVVDEQTKVEFVWIPPVANRASQPFYMMQDKVSNGLFLRFLKDSQNPDSRQILDSRDWRVWQKSRSVNDKFPVLHAMVEDAYHFSQWLGGSAANLPTIEQWDIASGLYKAGDPEFAAIWKRGPFTEPWDPHDPSQIAIARKHKAGPLEVGRTGTCDISYYGIRDMAGNAEEYCRNTRAGLKESFVPLLAPDEDVYVLLRGRDFTAELPFFFHDAKEREPSSTSYTEPRPWDCTAFRVVIDVKLSQAGTN